MKSSERKAPSMSKIELAGIQLTRGIRIEVQADTTEIGRAIYDLLSRKDYQGKPRYPAGWIAGDIRKEKVARW